MTPTDDKKMEIIYDHYKDTFQIQLKYVESRNKYFLIVLALISLLFFQMAFPGLAESILFQWMQKEISETSKINSSFFNSIFLFGLLWSLILYYQINLHIDRQYKYIHKLEENISIQISDFEISREGKSYTKPFPLVSWVIIRIYKFVFPSAILAAIGVKLNNEFYNNDKLFKIFNIIICILIGFISILYIVWVQWKDFSGVRSKMKSARKN